MKSYFPKPFGSWRWWVCLSLPSWVPGQLAVSALKWEYLETAPFQPTALVLGTEDQSAQYRRDRNIRNVNLPHLCTVQKTDLTGLRGQLSLFCWLPLIFFHIPCKMHILALESSAGRAALSLTPWSFTVPCNLQDPDVNGSLSA